MHGKACRKWALGGPYMENRGALRAPLFFQCGGRFAPPAANDWVGGLPTPPPGGGKLGKRGVAKARILLAKSSGAPGEKGSFCGGWFAQ